MLITNESDICVSSLLKQMSAMRSTLVNIITLTTGWTTLRQRPAWTRQHHRPSPGPAPRKRAVVILGVRAAAGETRTRTVNVNDVRGRTSRHSNYKSWKRPSSGTGIRIWQRGKKSPLGQTSQNPESG